MRFRRGARGWSDIDWHLLLFRSIPVPVPPSRLHFVATTAANSSNIDARTHFEGEPRRICHHPSRIFPSSRYSILILLRQSGEERKRERAKRRRVARFLDDRRSGVSEVNWNKRFSRLYVYDSPTFSGKSFREKTFIFLRGKINNIVTVPANQIPWLQSR